MKTDVCIINHKIKNMEKPLSETEKCGKYIGLSHKQQLQLRLLAEELLGMVRNILGDFRAEFWIETDEDLKTELHLRASSNMGITPTERDTLISVSSDGKNAAAKGIMGKLRQLFESGVFYGETGFNSAGDIICPSVEYDTYMLAGAWSLQSYRVQLEAKRDKNVDAWDELEKSIVANIADDVIVGVKGDVTEIVIKKDFGK